ncbi:MAG: fasciclin domain-containing protein [Leeuwenhoekiella sp.]
MKKYRIIPFTIVLLGALAFTSCKNDKKEVVENEPMETVDESAMAERADRDAKLAADEARVTNESSSIAAKAVASESLTTLVTALKAAGLDSLLTKEGSYTVLAPSNNAFEKLPEGTVENLLKPENKDQLKAVLQYHVIPGKITSDRLATAIKGNGGKYTFKNSEGDDLTAMMDGDQIVIKDGRGKKAHIVQGNIEASNGIVYIIDEVIMAKK